MSYNFLNPGYGKLFTTPGLYTDSSDSAYSKTGTSFQNGDAHPAILSLPNLSDLWIKFDYYDGGKYRWIQAYVNGRETIGIHGTNDSRALLFYSDYYNLDSLSVNTVMVHFNTSNNTADIWVNGIKGATVTDARLSGNTISSVAISSSGCGDNYKSVCNNWISNIIISDTGIDIGENIKIISAKDTITDMAKNDDGSFTATASGQSLLQSMDLSAENGSIKRIQVSGNPAYCTGGAMTKLDSIMKKSDTLEVKNTKTLTTVNSDVCIDAWIENKDTSYFSDVYVGWKAET